MNVTLDSGLLHDARIDGGDSGARAGTQFRSRTRRRLQSVRLWWPERIVYHAFVHRDIVSRLLVLSTALLKFVTTHDIRTLQHCPECIMLVTLA